MKSAYLQHRVCVCVYIIYINIVKKIIQKFLKKKKNLEKKVSKIIIFKIIYLRTF